MPADHSHLIGAVSGEGVMGLWGGPVKLSALGEQVDSENALS